MTVKSFSGMAQRLRPSQEPKRESWQNLPRVGKQLLLSDICHRCRDMPGILDAVVRDADC